jgi:hypothetical protein
MALAEIAAVGSLVSGVLGGLGGSKASKAAKKAAAEQARQEQVVTNERLRQIQQEERTLAGQTVARSAGAGGVVNQGSILQILAEQAREFRIEERVTRNAGASRVRTALAQGQSAARQFEAQGLSSLFAGIGQAAGIAYNAGLFSKNPTAPG